MTTNQKGALATWMKQLVDVYNQLGLVTDQEIISERSDSWRLNRSKHLDGHSICLDKSQTELTGTRICEEFALPNRTISTDVQKKKLPSMKEQTAIDIIVRDGKITQDDQGKFMNF
jgi:hypothetical protein